MEMSNRNKTKQMITNDLAALCQEMLTTSEFSNTLLSSRDSKDGKK